jgi:hypothetical protein
MGRQLDSALMVIEQGDTMGRQLGSVHQVNMTGIQRSSVHWQDFVLLDMEQRGGLQEQPLGLGKLAQQVRG